MMLGRGGHTEKHGFHLSVDGARQLLGPTLMLAALLVIPFSHIWQIFVLFFVAGVVSGGISAIVLVPAALIAAGAIEIWVVDTQLGNDLRRSEENASMGAAAASLLSIAFFSAFLLTLAGLAVAAVLRPWFGPEDPRP